MEHEDPRFKGFIELLQRNITTVSSSAVIGFLPWLHQIFPKKLIGADKVDEVFHVLQSYFKVIIIFKLNILNYLN